MHRISSDACIDYMQSGNTWYKRKVLLVQEVSMKISGKISIIALVWLAFIVQLLINQDLQRSGDVVEAFSNSDAIPVEACVSAYGDFGEMELAGDTKNTMLRNLAKQLGITDGYELTASEGTGYRESTLTKNGKYGRTVIQIVSMDTVNENRETVTKQMILCDITVYDDLEYAMECKELLEDIYEEIGMEPSLNVYLKGKTPGMITEKRREELVDSIFEELHATVVQEIDNENFYCIYGYTSQFDRVIYQNGRKINVNLAITYHEEEDMTYIHLAVPYISQSF